MEISNPSYCELCYFSWSYSTYWVLCVIWQYYPRCIVFHATKDYAGQFSYFSKKWRNCNLNIILKITSKAIKGFLVFWKATYLSVRISVDLKSELSLFGDLMWWGNGKWPGSTTPFNFFFLFHDKKIALHYIPLSSLGCESQWQISLSLKGPGTCGTDYYRTGPGLLINDSNYPPTIAERLKEKWPVTSIWQENCLFALMLDKLFICS